MVEVMMGLAILAVGASAIVALQRFAVMGTLTSRHVTNATNVTGSIIETMNTEAVVWTQNSLSPGDIAAMPWLGTALASASGSQVGQWVAPDARGFAVDGSAMLMAGVADAAPVAYCTHVRAAWLGNRTESAVGLNDSADSVRLEVRTFYAKSGRPIAIECRDWTGADVDTLMRSPAPLTAGAIDRTRVEYGTVYMTTVVRRTGT